MTRYTVILLLGLNAVPSSGFVIPKPGCKATRTTLCSHWPPASPSIRSSDRTSWSDYEHDYVDPLVAHAPDVDADASEEDDSYWTRHVVDDTYTSTDDKFAKVTKRDISDAFWLQHFEHDKEKLHRVMSSEENKKHAPDAQKTIGKPDNWSHYKHEYVEPNMPHPTEKKVQDPMTAEKRAIADEYWSKKNEEEKEKMAKMSPMDFLP